MVIPLSIGFLFSCETDKVRRSDGRLQRFSSLDGKTLLIGFSIILMILSLFSSASRMGILSLLLSFGLIMILCRGAQKENRFSRRSALILGLALFWAAWIGLDAVIGRFFGTSEDFRFRWAIWENTFQIIKDFPLFGSGLGTFTQVFPMYRSFHIRGMATHAENDFLQLASEVGLLGLTLLLILFLVLFFKVASGIRSFSLKDPRRYIGIGGLVGILALMFHSQVERNMQVPANAFLYTFLWGMILKLPTREVKKEPIWKNQ
jgi:O-antigen ligase